MSLDFPPIYLLATHLEPSALHDLEEKIPSLTYDINEAEIILGNIRRPERALFELRRLRIATEPAKTADATDSISPAKRRKLSPSPQAGHGAGTKDAATSHPRSNPSDGALIRVVRLDWFTESLQSGTVLPLSEYILYEGRRLAAACGSQQVDAEILTRALGDNPQPEHGPSVTGAERFHRTKIKPREHVHPPQLVRQSTSEQDENQDFPPIPAFLHTTYSCQRPTPVNPPGSAFVEELKKIRTTRILLGDQIGVRAYSTSIATLSAYPHKPQSAREVARLPGCGVKIVELYQEWLDTDKLQEASKADTDARMEVLRLFYDIWGVGDTTARDFYNRGWRDLDDLVEFAWDSHLSRVQQIGVKYYDDFKQKIPRDEVQAVGDMILWHARAMEPGYQMTIVGGFRRGKAESGDVDVIISHPDESKTLHLIERLVLSLEQAGLVTHTLTLSNKNSERGQVPLRWRGNTSKGTGFDTLDKAMVVWMQPQDEETARPRPHRRVDIIISPWKTVGCAVLGWSGETTFQRDLRRYCKKQKNLKFDSSGIRSRADGAWIDFEGGELGPAPSMEEAEKRVFRGLGLEWRPPEERCTG